MILIIESGATKSDWRVVSKTEKREIETILTKGLNVSAMQIESIADIIESASKEITNKFKEPISNIYLYLAGVATDATKSTLYEFFHKYLSPSAKIEIETDLMAAARGVLGRNPGIVGILGTGSNSCFYDGRQIRDKVNPGGYILGDEGGAASLGKLFVSDYIKGFIPDNVAIDFQDNHISDYIGIIEQVYKSGAPSKYLGSLAPFILKHYDNPYIKELVDNNFRAFFKRSLIPLLKRNMPQSCSIRAEKISIGIIGGFGYACKDIIEKIAEEEEEGVEITSFHASPIEGLIKYHLTH